MVDVRLEDVAVVDVAARLETARVERLLEQVVLARRPTVREVGVEPETG